MLQHPTAWFRANRELATAHLGTSQDEMPGSFYTTDGSRLPMEEIFGEDTGKTASWKLFLYRVRPVHGSLCTWSRHVRPVRLRAVFCPVLLP